MFKKFILFLLLPAVGSAQSLTLSIDNSTAGNGYSTYRLGESNVTFSRNSIRFGESRAEFSDFMTFGVTPDLTSVGILQNTVDGAKAYVLDAAGDTLAAYPTISLNYDDPSLAIYPLNSGAALIRNNIANFTLYNSLGTIVSSGSGSSQSEEGESISEVAMDANGKTILIYVPKIKQNGGGAVGSKANLLLDNNSTESIFYSDSREIAYGGVSDNGQFVVLITAAAGTDDRVRIMDRYGNDLNTITTDEDLSAAELTSDGRFIMVRSSSRVLVFSTMGGERLGSTSFRSTLLTARYFPEEGIILGITGNRVQNTEVASEIEFHAIHIERREIARRELDGGLGVSPKIGLILERTGAGRYRMLGASKVITLHASF